MARRERVVVGMSGGVDSSVAAWLLKAQGYDVVGLFMKNWEDDDTDEYCTSREDLVDAAAVADVIGIELEAVNFAAEYRERVFAHFLHDYAAGRTPNPDVLCNSEIKFRAFLDHAVSLGADRIATGHYARVRRAGGTDRTELVKAVDRSKDQTYFLHRLTQAQLAPVVFPLGEMMKRDVRALAQRERIPTYAKRDSTGICFIGERPFRDFLARYLPRTPGAIVTAEGAPVGRHDGLAYYTMGQRQGLGIGGTREGVAAPPCFVAGKDMARNELVAVQGHDHPLLYRRDVRAGDLHWIAGEAPGLPARFGAKTRYRMPDAPCSVSTSGDGAADARFDVPQWAPTPGQYLVFYDGEVCLGGGVIDVPPKKPSDETSERTAASSQPRSSRQSRIV